MPACSRKRSRRRRWSRSCRSLATAPPPENTQAACDCVVFCFFFNGFVSCLLVNLRTLGGATFRRAVAGSQPARRCFYCERTGLGLRSVIAKMKCTTYTLENRTIQYNLFGVKAVISEVFVVHVVSKCWFSDCSKRITAFAKPCSAVTECGGASWGLRWSGTKRTRAYSHR